VGRWWRRGKFNEINERGLNERAGKIGRSDRGSKAVRSVPAQAADRTLPTGPALMPDRLQAPRILGVQIFWAMGIGQGCNLIGQVIDFAQDGRQTDHRGRRQQTRQ
jgi:hypothetical protein